MNRVLIGMFFPVDTKVPAGFEFADMEPLEYVVCYLSDKENSGDFYTMDPHNMCLEKLRSLGLKRKEDWEEIGICIILKLLRKKIFQSL